MRTVGLFEAKQKLSEIVECAGQGERIGITRRGKLAALVVPASSDASLQSIFEDIDKIRVRSRHTKRISTKKMIEEGRL
ncbi:MAG: type II toxin-antitoxin system Phd/YefM family antitoxin [Blastocatellia bacterium]